MKRLQWILLLAGLAAPLGCSSMKSESAAPMDYASDAGYYAEGVAVSDAPERSRSEREFANFEEADMKTAPSGGASSEDIPAEAPKPAPDSQAGQPDDDGSKTDEPDHGRQMVYTASLQLAVYELDEVIEFAEDIPTRFGGWVQARNDYQITLRVPAAGLAQVMAELSALGLVLGKTLQASDVTAQYTDLESRIAVLEKMVTQLELLLVQAKTVEDSLKVRQELERVRIELEAARTQFRQLAELVGFSTLTLYLSLRGADGVLPTSNDPFPWVDELGVESTEFR